MENTGNGKSIVLFVGSDRTNLERQMANAPGQREFAGSEFELLTDYAEALRRLNESDHGIRRVVFAGMIHQPTDARHVIAAHHNVTK